jgi:hypothetical protein
MRIPPQRTMPDEEFKSVVSRAFEPEVASGALRVVRESYSEEAFGNAEVVLEASEFRLRLVRNRSELFAEAAHPRFPDEWTWLQLVIRAFRGEREVEHDYSIDPHTAAGLVRGNWDLLTRGFAKGWWRMKRARLRRLKDSSTTRLVEWLQSPEGRRQSAETDAAIEKELADQSPELKKALSQVRLKS